MNDICILILGVIGLHQNLYKQLPKDHTYLYLYEIATKICRICRQIQVDRHFVKEIFVDETRLQ
jgi:hypothetical protein